MAFSHWYCCCKAKYIGEEKNKKVRPILSPILASKLKPKISPSDFAVQFHKPQQISKSTPSTTGGISPVSQRRPIMMCINTLIVNGVFSPWLSPLMGSLVFAACSCAKCLCLHLDVLCTGLETLFDIPLKIYTRNTAMSSFPLQPPFWLVSNCSVHVLWFPNTQNGKIFSYTSSPLKSFPVCERSFMWAVHSFYFCYFCRYKALWTGLSVCYFSNRWIAKGNLRPLLGSAPSAELFCPAPPLLLSSSAQLHPFTTGTRFPPFIKFSGLVTTGSHLSKWVAINQFFTMYSTNWWCQVLSMVLRASA